MAHIIHNIGVAGQIGDCGDAVDRYQPAMADDLWSETRT